MRTLWCIKNNYTIYNKNEVVGWIRFIKWPDRSGWYIDEVSDGLAVTKADFDSEAAKSKLMSLGLTWKAGSNIPFYLCR